MGLALPTLVNNEVEAPMLYLLTKSDVCSGLALVLQRPPTLPSIPLYDQSLLASKQLNRAIQRRPSGTHPGTVYHALPASVSFLVVLSFFFYAVIPFFEGANS